MAHNFDRFPELTNSQAEHYYWQSPHKQIFEDFKALVVKVHDGDTIRVKWTERDFEFPIRLALIDAPELNERGGAKSKSWLEAQILGKEVEIIIDKERRIGKWGRILGEIMFMGRNINKESMDLGFSKDFFQEPSEIQPIKLLLPKLE